jgi:hypothetical protein
MRFVHLYLLGYFILVLGAALTLWQAGILARISPTWLMTAGIIVVGLGILLAATSTRTTAINANNP